MNLVKKILSNIWFWIALVFTIVLGLLGHEQSKNKLLGLQLFKALFDNKDQKIEDEKLVVKSDITKEEAIQAELKKQHDQSKSQVTSKDDVEDFWKKH